jgi:hypothetical protein
LDEEAFRREHALITGSLTDNVRKRIKGQREGVGEGVLRYLISAMVVSRSTSIRRKNLHGGGMATCSFHGLGIRASLCPPPPTGNLWIEKRGEDNMRREDKRGGEERKGKDKRGGEERIG